MFWVISWDYLSVLCDCLGDVCLLAILRPFFWGWSQTQ